MKIVNATWERRNLGCDAWEVTLDSADMSNPPNVIAMLHDARFAGAYVCVKLPVGNLKMVHALEDDGFRFLETQLSLIDRFLPDDIFEQCETSHERIVYKPIKKDRGEWERVIAKITPALFDTDRISLDPLLGPEIACKRYQNWIRDLFDNPKASLSVMEVDGQEVSFALEMVDGKSRQGILGGNFPEFKRSGYGVALNAGSREGRIRAKRRTVVSSNNLSVLRVHQNCGCVVYKEMYVLRKFVGRSGCESINAKEQM